MHSNRNSFGHHFCTFRQCAPHRSYSFVNFHKPHVLILHLFGEFWRVQEGNLKETHNPNPKQVASKSSIKLRYFQLRVVYIAAYVQVFYINLYSQILIYSKHE